MSLTDALFAVEVRDGAAWPERSFGSVRVTGELRARAKVALTENAVLYKLKDGLLDRFLDRAGGGE